MDVKYCSYCLRITDEELTAVIFRDLFIPPIKFKFCPACFKRLINEDREMMAEMKDRHKRIRNPQAYSNFRNDSSVN